MSPVMFYFLLKPVQPISSFPFGALAAFEELRNFISARLKGSKATAIRKGGLRPLCSAVKVSVAAIERSHCRL